MLESEVRALSRGGVPSGAHIFDVDGAAVKVFVETLLPPVPLVIFGAGHDALPVVELARGLGWQTEVVDPQARPASRSRFAAADRVTLARPEDVGAQVSITPRTLTLLMSHNYSHDLALLRFLLASPARYIGVMGPRKRTERMLSELAAGDDAFRLEEADLAAPLLPGRSGHRGERARRDRPVDRRRDARGAGRAARRNAARAPGLHPRQSE